MKYEDIKTPKELLFYMNENFSYGFVDKSGMIYDTSNMIAFQNACKEKWFLSSPSRLRKVKLGHCWDFVEFEREWFQSHGYSFQTFYIYFDFPYETSYSIHTYLIYQENGKYYYFEYSNLLNRGIYEFASLEEAIMHQKEKHIESNKRRNPVGEEERKRIHIYEYDNPPYHCSQDDFIDFIMNYGKELHF